MVILAVGVIVTGATMATAGVIVTGVAITVTPGATATGATGTGAINTTAGTVTPIAATTTIIRTRGRITIGAATGRRTATASASAGGKTESRIHETPERSSSAFSISARREPTTTKLRHSNCGNSKAAGAVPSGEDLPGLSSDFKPRVVFPRVFLRHS